MKRTRGLSIVLISSLILNAWLGWWAFSTESRNRQALASPAQIVAYRLTNLTRFADSLSDQEWADVSTRTWIYDSVLDIVDFGSAAQGMPAHGLPAEVAWKLGELASRMEHYRAIAHRLAFNPPADTLADRAQIRGLAQQIRAAGWGPPAGPGKPAGWTYGRDWGEQNRALDRLLATL